MSPLTPSELFLLGVVVFCAVVIVYLTCMLIRASEKSHIEWVIPDRSPNNPMVEIARLQSELIAMKYTRDWANERLEHEKWRVAALLKECEAYRADRDQRIATHQGQPT